MSDETLREVADLLFGGGGDELISKLAQDPASKDRRKRGFTAGLSAVGAAAGAGGLALSAKELHHGAKTAKKAGLKPIAGVKQTLRTKKLAAALLPLEVAGLGGELMATKILHGDTKKPKKEFAKSDPTSSDVHIPTTTGQLKLKVAEKAYKKGKPKAKDMYRVISGTPEVSTDEKKIKIFRKSLKPVDVTWEGEFSKVDADKRQVFGWASIVEMNGQPVVDLQGDYIDHDELEKSAYDYVIKSRKGGNMHLRNGEEPVHVSDMIESFLVTPEKKEKMGLPDEMPTGWWVGYQINDDEAWNLVKSGKRTGFSIHGKGQRVPAII